MRHIPFLVFVHARAVALSLDLCHSSNHICWTSDTNTERIEDVGVARGIQDTA
jgi:hypothetical protein